MQKAWNKTIGLLNHWITAAPGWTSASMMVVLTVLITSNPFYLNNRINLYELSLYAPGIYGIQNGLVPYRDFFHLRGPLELYMPVWMMEMFGSSINTLSFYFFFGNVLCLVFVVLIARELIKSRFVFYLMVPAIVARAFPRVCYMNWGGMRYAFGLMAIFCFIRFLRTRRLEWVVGAGLVSAFAALTSVEIGICAVLGIIGCLMIALIGRFLPVKEAGVGLLCFIAAGLIGITPWIVYSIQSHAFVPYIESIVTMATRFQTVINPHLASVYPSNVGESLAAMFNPGHENFKQLTPAYAYLALLGLLIWRYRKNLWGTRELGILSLGIYGFVLYVMAFRALLASQFEMALMPEKIVYFFVIEAVVLYLWQRRATGKPWKEYVIAALVIVLFAVSVGSAISRFSSRFWSFQCVRSVLSGKGLEHVRFANKNERYEELELEKAKGFSVPEDQAKELNQLQAFIQTTSPEHVIVMFPELGVYNFMFDRAFAGRFGMSDLAWLNDQWFEEYYTQLKNGAADYVIVQKRMPPQWEEIYFGYAPNKVKHDRMVELISTNYRQVAQTPGSWIYKRKQ